MSNFSLGDLLEILSWRVRLISSVIVKASKFKMRDSASSFLAFGFLPSMLVNSLLLSP